MIGIILLDSRFPRPPGDLGNPATFSFPVLYEKVEGAFPVRVVKGGDSSLLFSFVEAARKLERRGARAITTSCGFLGLYQKELASAVQIPVFTSSLVQIPWVYDLVGRRGRIGVLTADEEALTLKHLEGVGAESIPTIIRGMKPESEFFQTYVEDRPKLNYAAVEREIVTALQEMAKDHIDLSALVLECTNMTPYREALRKVFDRPIFDILTLIRYIHSTLR